MITHKIHYYLGLVFGVKYRKWYCEKHGRKWIWGINKAINDDSTAAQIKGSKISQAELSDMLKSLTEDK